MPDIILQDYVANVIKIDGVCYYLVENTHADPTHTAGQVEAYYDSCEKCNSSSSSSSSSSTSFSSSSSSTSFSSSSSYSSSSSSSSTSYSSSSSFSNSSSSSSTSNSSSSSSSSTQPPPPQEIKMVITGLTGGDTWNGFDNGTHSLDGSETLVTGVTNGYHIWQYGNPGTYFSLHDIRPGAGIIVGLSGYGFRFSWTAKTIYYNLNASVTYGTAQPSIGFKPYVGSGAPFSGTTGSGTPVHTLVLGGGESFTWSIGTDWSRGNM